MNSHVGVIRTELERVRLLIASGSGTHLRHETRNRLLRGDKANISSPPGNTKPPYAHFEKKEDNLILKDGRSMISGGPAPNLTNVARVKKCQ